MDEITVLTALEMKIKEQKSPVLSPYIDYNDYLEYLTKRGITLNPKIEPSVFELKNGLPYVGMGAKTAITGGQVLIRVPEELVLSSTKAAEEPQLAEVFKDPFFISQHQSWEDRVLIVYSLFLLHKKDENNPWYQMVKRFPRSCDIACFWSEQELSAFKDTTMKRSAELDRKGFEQEWAAFEQLQSKHSILQHEEFNKQNYRVIFMTEINRAFGASLSYVSLVPFAELFNHHCSTVFYSTEKNKQTYLQDNEEKWEQQSLGSCESDEYIEQNEFAYDRVNTIPYNWDCQQSYKLYKKQKTAIADDISELSQLISNSLNWQSLTIKFVAPLLFKINVIKKQYLVGRKPYSKAKEELLSIKKSVLLFKELIGRHYETVHKRSYIKKEEKKEEKGNKNTNSSLYPPYQKEFENFIIKTGKNDRFETNNQVFFRYGHNSNRTLLLHYGFAIQGNKYEHYWLSFSLANFLREYPDVLDRMMDKHLSLNAKFKLYNHRLNIDLIIFFRLSNWAFYGQKSVEELFRVGNPSKQIKVIEQIIEVLEGEAKKYEGKYDLTNSKLNYHQYFVEVYHLQKLSILKKQIYLLMLIIDILVKMDNGSSLQQSIKNLTKSEQTVLSSYLSTLVF